jgi:type V secretory pathway adhesin AidA
VLSSNDFTDEDKQKLDGITTHTHANLPTLNKITDLIWTRITETIKSDEYNLQTYKTSDVTSINGKFYIKNDRAVINAELVLDSSLTNTSIILLQNLPIDTNVQYKFEFNEGNYTIANKKLTVNFNNSVVVNLILNLVFDLYKNV